MKFSTGIFALVLALTFAVAAGAQTTIDYGWEDAGTVLGLYPDATAMIPTNVAGYDGNPVHSGNFSLKLVDNLDVGTPQAFVALLWNLRDGDEITVGFWRYDDTPDTNPSVRLWGHWDDELPLNPDGYSGSAGGNGDYGLGLGWDYTEWVYTVAGNTGLVIEARTYTYPGDTVWLDDMHIVVPDHVYVQIPGCSPVPNEPGTWGGVKALFR